MTRLIGLATRLRPSSCSFRFCRFSERIAQLFVLLTDSVDLTTRRARADDGAGRAEGLDAAGVGDERLDLHPDGDGALRRRRGRSGGGDARAGRRVRRGRRGVWTKAASGKRLIGSSAVPERVVATNDALASPFAP